METLPALLAICAGNPPVTGGFPSQRTGCCSFDDLLVVCLSDLLNKQSGWRWTDSRILTAHVTPLQWHTDGWTLSVLTQPSLSHCSSHWNFENRMSIDFIFASSFDELQWFGHKIIDVVVGKTAAGYMSNGPLTRYVKLWVAHALGMPVTFSPPPNSKETAG